MLSIMNEIDPCLLLSLCVLDGIQNQIFLHLAPDEANYVLRKVHEGACGNHSGVRSLVHKVVCASYYWPTVQADAKAYVKVCDQCQRFSNVPR